MMPSVRQSVLSNARIATIRLANAITKEAIAILLDIVA